MPRHRVSQLLDEIDELRARIKILETTNEYVEIDTVDLSTDLKVALGTETTNLPGLVAEAVEVIEDKLQQDGLIDDTGAGGVEDLIETYKVVRDAFGPDPLVALHVALWRLGIVSASGQPNGAMRAFADGLIN